jgi:hypothetical protein
MISPSMTAHQGTDAVTRQTLFAELAHLLHHAGHFHMLLQEFVDLLDG